MPFFVYILKSESTGNSYVGHTSNLEKRLNEHNNGRTPSTRNKKPWKLVYKEEFPNRSQAVRRETYFKSIKGRMELKEKGIL
jgi:putative endonuclease